MNPSVDLTWLLVCTVLVMLMQAGFLCLETGLTRSKNNINVAVKNLADLGISLLMFWAVGYGLMFGASQAGWFGGSGFAPNLGEVEPATVVFFLFQALFCGTAVTIMSGAVAGRLRFAWYIAIAFLVTSTIYPLLGHWIWHENGWLNHVGFVDFAGGTVVHSTGGWAGLAIILILGPRRGRFDRDTSSAVAGANVPFATLGALLLWVGWVGFNGGSLLRFDDQVVTVIANTAVAGAAGLMASLGIGWAMTGLPRVTDSINGLLAGLVSITATANAVSTRYAILIGAIGALVAKVLEVSLERRRVDDAVGAVPVHLGAGIWGTIAVAGFAGDNGLGTGHSVLTQLGVQCFGVLVTGCWVFGTIYTFGRVLDRRWPLRVSREDEEIGLNISEHGASTDLADLFQTMEMQAATGDLTQQVPTDPFTQAGQIGERYNAVVAALTNSQQALGASERTAQRDPLTKTLNRRGVMTTLRSLSGGPTTMFMIDVVRFGSFNGALGYSAGDDILVQVSEHMSRRLGNDWYFGRWGGDEFVAVASGARGAGPEILGPVVCTLATGAEIAVSMRVGAYHAPAGLDADEAIRRTTYALDESKRSGTSVVVFDGTLASRYERARELAIMLDDATLADRIIPFGQTLFQEGQVAGVELLARWRNGDGSFSPPGEFLPVLIENGRMRELDLHMVSVACSYAAQFDGPHAPWIAVNVSAPTLIEPGLVSHVEESLTLTGISPERLVVEITETEHVEAPQHWLTQARELRSLGVGLAIDDFGSGYSSIDRMSTLPITHVKFDRSLVIAAEGPLGAVMKSVVDYARGAGVVTVAEGIETEDQHAAMRALGVDLVQGFLFSRPVDLRSVTDGINATLTTR